MDVKRLMAERAKKIRADPEKPILGHLGPTNFLRSGPCDAGSKGCGALFRGQRPTARNSDTRAAFGRVWKRGVPMTDRRVGGNGVGAVRDVLEDVAQFGGRARKALDETAHKAGDIASEFADEAVTRGRKASKYVVREVKEHPVATIAIGAAVGVLVAALLMRKRD